MSNAYRQPMNGKCADPGCAHEFVVCYLPMELTKAAELMKRARCPMCAGAKVLCA
jgi:hypothetical protein